MFCVEPLKKWYSQKILFEFKQPTTTPRKKGAVEAPLI